MSELAVSLLRLSYLLLLWLFVLAALAVLRRDTYGTKILRRGVGAAALRRGRRQRVTAPAIPPGRVSLDDGAPRPRVPLTAVPSPAAPPAAAPVQAPPAASAPTRLVVTSGPLKGTSLPLGNGVTIGRSATSNLVLDDEFTSGHHAHVVLRDGRWFVEDLGSTNGTFLGRRRVSEPVAVAVGTSLRIGQTRVELR
jgi:hypothetical protein